jgi:hypothetical protein
MNELTHGSNINLSLVLEEVNIFIETTIIEMIWISHNSVKYD